jgi:hypothetical protein
VVGVLNIYIFPRSATPTLMVRVSAGIDVVPKCVDSRGRFVHSGYGNLIVPE